MGRGSRNPKWHPDEYHRRLGRNVQRGARRCWCRADNGSASRIHRRVQAVRQRSNKHVTGANDYAAIVQPIEGYRIAPLAWGTASARPITIGFWVYAQRSGTYSGAIRNSAANRCYVFPIVVASAITWQWVTVTIPGDTTGTWLNTSGIGMYVSFALMAGSSFQTTANMWTAGGFIGVTGTLNGVFAGNDNMIVTGLVVIPGSYSITSVQASLFMRPYDEELARCQRYFYKRNFTGQYWFATLLAFSTTQASGPMYDFPVQMRIAPTASAAGTYGLASATGGQLALTGGAILTTPDGCSASVLTVASGLVAGDATLYGSASTGYQAFDARL